MATFRTSALVMLALGGVCGLGQPAAAREHLTPEQELAKILKGREAGKPVDCITLSEISSTQIIDKTAIVYEAGRTIYVNRPKYPEQLSSDDILVTRSWGNQLCRMDIVYLRERGMPGMMGGSVGLEAFVPYTKPKPAPAPVATQTP